MNQDLPKVIVLLSSYNGERYITEQIDSILSQTYPNIELVVRDDGSSDGTLKILESYEAKQQLRLYRGHNMGFVSSFLWLTAIGGDAPLYAFADQDDVWLPDKIEKCVSKMLTVSAEIPALCYTNYDLYDEDLQFISHRSQKKVKTCFRNSLVDCAPLGFNMMFNHKAKELVIARIPKKCLGHDWWMYMVCSGLGTVLYEDSVTVKYRRHSANASNEGDGMIKKQIWRFKKFFLGGFFARIREQIREYEQIFGESLSEQNRRELALFTRRGFHPVNALHKAFYPKYYRQKFMDEVLIRFIMLLGQL